MSRYEHGRILAVNESTLGSELVADHAAGVTSLTVADPVDFDEDGGWLKVGDDIFEYDTFDDDTGEITLRGATTAAASEGDPVFLWDTLREVVTTDKIAEVVLDGDDDNVDPIEATVPLQFLDDLVDGIRGTTGESVLLELDGEEWRIVDVLGLAAAGAVGQQWEADDVYVITTDDLTAGVATCPLTHHPIVESVSAKWGVLSQEPTEYTVNYDAQTVTWPLDGFEQAGDRLWFHYTYFVATTPRAAILIGDPWRYAENLGPSTAYADPAFDDSAWSTGASGLGYDDDGGAVHSDLNTLLASRPLDVWTRASITTRGRDLHFYTPIVDDYAKVYLDGVLVWSPDYTQGTDISITVPVAAGEHLIAVYATSRVGSDAWTGFEVTEQ